MQSRARLLLEREQFKLKKYPVWGITAQLLNEDNWFIWEAKVNGPKDTLWEGGVFKLYLQFNENYNCLPPRVYFHTIPFHPNVDPMSGIPCMDFLDSQEEWKDYYSIKYILLSIQMLLSNPVLENAVNVEAAIMCQSAPEAYRQMILDNVLASKRVEAGLKPHLENEIDKSESENHVHQAIKTDQSNKRLVHVAKISFEDYHSLWSGIATTKPAPASKNPLNDILRCDSKLQAAHFGMEKQELQEEIQKQITEHNSLMYGKFGESNKKQNLEEMKATRINMLKQIYLPEQQGPDKSSHDYSNVAPSSASISTSISKDIEPSDHEVEELLHWSSNLGNDDVSFK